MDTGECTSCGVGTYAAEYTARLEAQVAVMQRDLEIKGDCIDRLQHQIIVMQNHLEAAGCMLAVKLADPVCV